MKHAETARRLRYALSLNNMKAHELADLSGLNKASVSQYLNGVHAPSNMSAGRMGKVLDVSPVWLMGFDVPMQVDTDNQERRLKAYLDKLSKLDEIDRAKLEERLDTMLESDKYKGV